MAISTVWSNFPNGEQGSVVRNSLNTFNTNILSDMVSTEGRVTANEGRLTVNEADIDAAEATILDHETRITDNEAFRTNPKPTIQFDPQLSSPTHTEGTMYYDDVTGSMKVQGPVLGVEAELGHGEHVHVVNNTGSIIPKGTACRHNGVAAGKVQIVPALADSFTNARVFGLASEDIGIGADGAITTSGQIRNMDTSAMPVGVPLYLSDTIAGTYTTTKPDIVSQVGGAITQDALTGQLFVQLINNTSLPTVLAGMKNLTTPALSLTGTPQDILGYITKEEVVMLADITTGYLTISNDGYYRTSVSANVTFPSSTSTRTIYVELYDVTNTTILFTYTKNIPRDATEDSFSFSYPFSGVADNQYKLRVYASTAFTVTANNVTFDIQSINIQ